MMHWLYISIWVLFVSLWWRRPGAGDNKEHLLCRSYSVSSSGEDTNVGVSKKTETMLGSGLIVLASATVGQSSSSSSPCEAGVGS